jgi:hypothetical protein
MPQFTTPRGARPGNVEGEVVLDTRAPVVYEDSNGNPYSVVEGVVVTVVRPTGNDGTAAVFVNDEKVAAGIPEEDVDKVVAKVLKKVDA